MIRVLVADDDRFIREALAELIGSETDMQVVGLAADAAEAVAQARAVDPDVALLDVKMPAGGGERAAAGIREDSPRTRVVALSADGDSSSVTRMFEQGAAAYVVKGAMGDEILSAIRSALRAEVAQPAQDPRVSEEVEQERRVRQVLSEGLLAVQYQPVLDIEAGSIWGVEALTRFTATPSRPPRDWFDAAAATGRRRELELLTMRTALAQLDRLPAGVVMSINASPDTVASAEVVRLLTGVPESRVVLEIAEDAPIEDFDDLRRLREGGVMLAADDVGAAEASLSRLLRLVPAALKLHAALTRGAVHPGPRRAILRAFVAFGAERGIPVIAKSVEHRDELAALREQGVTHVQGYLVGRPGSLPLQAEELAGRVTAAL